ncbi:MAG: preprotein translocase subunit SecE [Lachnospiraceae bacterium]|nr:preprotein translocase subunit SecE [Lachnospiraceae bacterium]
MAEAEEKKEKKDSQVAKKTGTFWKGVKAEFKKIIWPDRKTLYRQTVAVVVVSVITGALIAVLDRALQYGINFLVR